MLSISGNELINLFNAYIWPLTRILGLIAMSPPFGNNMVPMQVKIVLGLALAALISPTLPPPPLTDPTSLVSIAILLQQFIIGIGMGFVMRIVFAAIEMAGEISGLTMGLGFATFFDPQTQGRSSAIAQFLVLVSTVLFLSLNAHLALLSLLVESFQIIPISTDLTQGLNLYRLMIFAEQIFIAGLKLSLPIVTALLIANIALGILTRAAPQLNLFGIGFPITIGVGFLMLGIILPYLATPLEQLFQFGLGSIKAMATHPKS